MSKKSYNQLIFLTTLSVYLGLVLVGSSPQILAQTALTAKFEIKDQIEKQNDLDRNDDEIEVFAKAFDAESQGNELTNRSKNSLSSRIQNVSLNSLLAESDSFSLNLKLPLSKNETTKQAIIAFNNFLTFKLKEKAVVFQTTLENPLDFEKKTQAFVITRFPRASIDLPSE